MIHANFVHLHFHSEYSLLDGAISLDKAIKQAHEFKMAALAITDHGNLFGAIKFYRKAYAMGIKPIIGCEVYVAPHSRKVGAAQPLSSTETSYHLVLLVKDIIGYKNLMNLVSLGYLEGFYRKPRVDKELLEKFHGGLICLSGCIKGEVPSLILKGKLKQAEEAAKWYQSTFGKGNYYLELLDHGLQDEKKVIEGLIKISDNLAIPLVATNDVHYIKKEDASVHDILLCIQTQTKVQDTKRLKFSSDEFYFKSSQEMSELFRDHPKALSNTVEIAEHCNLELDFEHLHLPHYEVGEGYTLNSFLRKLCYEGMYTQVGDKLTEEQIERLEQELKIIEEMKYAGYFLIIWDMIRYAREKGIPVGPGRGSAAGSLVAYALRITQIDPLKYNLLFERFLNPDRVTMPDIDIDFCYERREEVIDYISKKYGADKVSQIITFGRMQAKAVIRDVGRALDIPYSEVDKIARMVPPELNITLNSTLERVEAFGQSLKEGGQLKALIDAAFQLEGLVRHASTHAAGVVISSEPLINLVPLYKEAKSNSVVTQYDKDSIEAIGLLKMDFLGLRTLTVIDNVIRKINQTGITIHLEDIPLDDAETYKLLSEGEAIGLFQLESSGMRDLLRRLKPTSFEEIIALVALYRPGPLSSGMIDEFIQNKYGKEVTYFHPALKPVLEETYGMIVYQEQVMRIASDLAGFSMSEADELRRAMSKKNPEKMELMRERFIAGAKKYHKIDDELSNKIFELMARFAEYGFNKSHSAAYALISYQTAYLKARFGLYFMTELLSGELGNPEKISFYIAECKQMKIDLLPPDINESVGEFAITNNNAIRFGLLGVKNVGIGTINSIVKNRARDGNFTSLYDFCNRVDLRLVNKRVVESLIKCGAFDSIGNNRAQLMDILDHALEIAATTQKDRTSGQISLFDVFDGGTNYKEQQFQMPDIPEWPQSKLLRLEKEMLGLYVSAHPLNRFEEKMKYYASHTILQLKTPDFSDKDVTIAGMIKVIKQITTKNERKMAFVEVEDLYDSIEMIVFPDIYDKTVENIIEDEVVIIQAKVNKENEDTKLIADDILRMEILDDPPLDNRDSDKFRKKTKKIVNYTKSSIIPLPYPPPTGDRRENSVNHTEEATVKQSSHFDQGEKSVHIRVPYAFANKDDLIRVRNCLVNSPGISPVYLHIVDKDSSELVISPSIHLMVSFDDQFVAGIKKLLGEDAVWRTEKKSVNP